MKAFVRLTAVFVLFAIFAGFVSCAKTDDVERKKQENMKDSVEKITGSQSDKASDGMSSFEAELGLDPYVPNTTFNLRPGLYVENGVMTREGEEYVHIGVNYTGAFLNKYLKQWSNEYIEIFDLMNEYDIEYARINMGMFWPTWYAMWENDKAAYYNIMDEVVHAAEDRNIGLICSMFWHTTGVSDYFDEPANAWADPESKTRAYMSEYLETVVSRYKDSPAIWGWEYANEYNLMLDLPNAWDMFPGSIVPSMGSRLERDENDIYLTDWAEGVLKAFAETVKEFDPYDRMITSGNGEPRPTQYHQRLEGSWKLDSVEEMAETLKWHNPDPIDTVSIHTYKPNERFYVIHDPELKYEDKIFALEDYIEQIAIFKEESAKLGKALFIGEFWWEEGEYQKIIDAIVEVKVPISAIWAIGEVEWTADTDPVQRARLLSYIQQANLKLRG